MYDNAYAYVGIIINDLMIMWQWSPIIFLSMVFTTPREKQPLWGKQCYHSEPIQKPVEQFFCGYEEKSEDK